MTVEHMIEILRKFPNSRFGDPRHGGEVGIIDIIDVLEKRPEIIHCEECVYRNNTGTSVRWLPCMEVATGDYWFCGSAERREG